MRHGIPAKVLGTVLDAAARRGVGTAVACAAADLDPAAVADPDERVPFAKVVRLYDACARLSGDTAFGLHAGEAAPSTMFDVSGFIMMSSATVGEALKRLERYQRVWTDGAVLRTTVDGSRARVEYTYGIADPGPEGRRQECEAALAILTMRVRALAGTSWQPDAVWCEHGAPGDTSEHSRLFRCPIAFGQASNALIFKPAVLSQAVAWAAPELSAALDHQAEELLSALPSNGAIAVRVREVLVHALRGGDLDLAAIARELGMSTRTLQRRLQEEDTSLQELIDDVRRDLSARYLQRPDLTIADVAYLLGFAEPVTFHRVFRKWTGQTPAEFRRSASTPETRRASPHN